MNKTHKQLKAVIYKYNTNVSFRFKVRVKSLANQNSGPE